MRFIWAWLLVGVAAQAKPTLHLAELPDVVRHAEVSRERAFTIEEAQRGESAILLLSMRAQQLADPRGRLPMFVPALSSTCIGGSLRLDF
jgi:hypothetical protein